MMKSASLVLVALVAVAGGVAAGFAMDVSTPSPWERLTSRADEDPQLVALRIESPASHWQQGGFVTMEPSVPLPRAFRDSSKTDVYLRIPQGTRLGEGLRYPPGTIADRVESLLIDGSWTVGDVRGARIDDNGNRMLRLFRPENPEAGAPLIGFEWPESRDDLTRRVHETFAELFAEGSGLAGRRGHAVRERASELFLTRGDCVGCHQMSRGDHDTAVIGRPNRATDAHGFYAPLSALRQAVPLEAYRPVATAQRDPYVALLCDDASEPGRVEDARGGVHFECEDGSIPWGHLDAARAMRDGDERAAAVCRARAYLADYLHPDDRERFRDAIGACTATVASVAEASNGDAPATNEERFDNE